MYFQLKERIKSGFSRQEKQANKKGKNMKNQHKTETPDDFMRDEYDFDYSKGVRGKYARKAIEENGYIKLSPELQRIFKSSEEVNIALKAIISAIPKSRRRTTKIA